MLGLPSPVRACLFDLDGVLTQTAKVHAAAWKEMFDGYLRERPRRQERFVPFDAVADYDEYVDGKPRYDGVRSFLASRGIELPEGDADDPADGGDGRRARQPQERDRSAHDPASRAWRPTRGRCATSARRATPGCAARWSPRAPTAARCWTPPGSRICSRQRIDGVVAEREHLKGKPAPDTFLAGARALGRRARRRRRSSRTRWPGSRPGEPAASASWSASTASARPTRCASTARTSSSPTSPSCSSSVIQHPAFAVEPWALRETELDLEVLAQSESVFALSNGHIGLRGNLDEGEPIGLPGTYLNGVLRGAPAALRRGRLRLPGGGADRRQRHQRQDHPAAGRRRALRRPLRRAAQPRADARLSRRRAARAARSGSRRPGRQVRVSSTRLVSFVQRAVAADALRGRAARRARRGSWCSRSWWPTSRCRPRADDPRDRGERSESPLRVRAVLRPRRQGRARALDQGERAADGRRRWITSSRARRGTETGAAESGEDLGARDDHGRTRSPGSGCASSSSSPTAGRAGARARRCATRSRPRWPRRGTPAGTGSSPASAPTSTTSGSAPTSSSRATPSSSRRCASRSSTRCRPAPGPSGARSRPRA